MSPWRRKAERAEESRQESRTRAAETIARAEARYTCDGCGHKAITAYECHFVNHTDHYIIAIARLCAVCRKRVIKIFNSGTVAHDEGEEP